MKHITICTSILLSLFSVSVLAQSPVNSISEQTNSDVNLLSYTYTDLESTSGANPVKETSNTLCKKGVYKFTQKDYVGAIQSYNKSIELDNGNVNAIFNRANAQFALKNYKLAIIDYTKVIELEPTDKVAYLQRGMTKMAMGQNKKAIKDFTTASRLDRHFMDAYLQRGVAKLNSGNFEDAKRDFKIVIKYKPSSFVYLQTALSEMGIGNYSQAKKDLTKSIELDSQNAEAYFKRGVASYDGGSKKNAISDWKIANSMGHKLSAKALVKYGN